MKMYYNLTPKNKFMNTLVSHFLNDPKQLKALENNASLLNEAFYANKDLCYKFFTFQHWHLIYRDVNKSTEILDAMRSNVGSFADGVKCYHALAYDDRKNYIQNLINLANSVQDLEFVLRLVGNSYRKQIVEKMKQVATTDEDRKKVSFYHI